MKLTSVRLISVFAGLLGWFVLNISGSIADEYAEILEILETCASCHGESGLPKEDNIPINAGQELYYLYVQMKDIKSGMRKSEVMEPFLEDLNKKQLMSLAKYFSEQKWPRIQFKGNPETVKKGELGMSAGQCAACHLGSYTGNSRVPRLAGQQPKYLEKTMLDFKNKVRKNSPAKGSLMSSFSDSDIAAMAEFLGDL